MILLAAAALGPFVQLITVFGLFFLGLFLTVILMPSLGILLAVDLRSRYWRLPALWVMPSLVAALLIVLTLGDPAGAKEAMEGSGWYAAGMLVLTLWSVFVVAIALIHLIGRLVRYVMAREFKRLDRRRLVSRVIYGWGNYFVGAFLLLCAAMWRASGAVGLSLLAVLTLLVGYLNSRRPAPRSDPTPQAVASEARRLLRAVGAVLLAVLTLTNGLITVLLLLLPSETEPGSLEALIAIVWGVILVASVLAWWLSAPRPARSTPSAALSGQT